MKYAYYSEDGLPVEIIYQSDDGKYVVAHPDGALIDDKEKFEPIDNMESLEEHYDKPNETVA